ncbi:hypothetical protein skT53_06190 [Effusibacillus dendaii]|uniref:DUF1232 domain-containing protein n=2 Tax=Effusibacillus dendaii TaxID=2743772 RepID=A0A7I8D682_9BACL|nr:hypothetical protein skT53_06190 [Effusibacillus dendaii]
MADVLEAPQIYEAYLLLSEYLCKKDAGIVLSFYETLDSVLDENEGNSSLKESSIDYALLFKMIQNLYHHCTVDDVTIHIKEGFQGKVAEVSGFSSMLRRLRTMYKCFLYEKQLSIKERAWLATTLLYFISPIDLVPDYSIPYGYIDDSIVVGFVFYKLFTLLKKYTEVDSLQTHSNETVYDLSR